MDPAGRLIERDDALLTLHTALARARAGRGEIALVAGEAGAGKTSLVGEFVGRAAGPPVVLRGFCDPLSSPRPLGPLIDAVGSFDSDLARQLAAGLPRADAFSVALSLIDGTRSDGRVVVVVIEDMHWADEATLDLLTFLGRRIAAHPALLVITYRDDEVGSRHELRVRLGELGPAIGSRLTVPPLSPSAVAQLATGTGVDADALHRITGGNAFFVTEVLGAGTQAVPTSVSDAVLARVARLPEAARAVLDAAAIFPGRVERWLLDATVLDVGAEIGDGYDTCVEHGLLRREAATDTTTFRHELARLAVLDTIVASRRRALHRRALAALVRRAPADVARLAVHASEAGDGEAVARYAPAAAEAAAAVGAHREAELHLARALEVRDRMPPHERADLLLRHGEELAVLGNEERAVAELDAAAATYESVDDTEGQVGSLLAGWRALVGLGRQRESEDRMQRAAALLDGREPSSIAAKLATAQTRAHMLARQFDAAELAGLRAITTAREVGDDATLAEALIQTGIATAMDGDDGGLARIGEGIAIASRLGLDHLVALGQMQIGSGYGELRRYDIAVPALHEGMAFADSRELVAAHRYMRAWLARCELELGHWDAAATLAGGLIRDERCTGISRFVALVTLAWLRGRRGDPQVAPLLDEALALARATGHLQRLWPVAACRAEIAWIAGRLDAEVDLVEEAASLADDLGYAPAREELAHWLHLADGAPRGDVDGAATPFGLTAAGRPDLAVARWTALGCPFEAATARLLAGRVDDLRDAYASFDLLGAGPMRTLTANALRSAGAPVPRGATAATRENPHTLTAREMEVLALIATGRTNREIADVLRISVKTAGHHVSHVLAKLQVKTRAEAAVKAERLGLTDHR